MPCFVWLVSFQIVYLVIKTWIQECTYLPAPLSLTSTCSDMVIFEDLLADRNDEYKTQHIQTIRPIMLSLSKPIWLAFEPPPPTMPNKPGLHLSSARNSFNLILI